MDFSWRINGWIRDVASKPEALLKARSLHQNLLLVLASEPAFRFAAGNMEAPPLPELNSGYAVLFEPERIRLVMPQTAPLGFSTAQPGLQSDGLTISLTRPSQSARSFSSVAEVVAHSPAAIFLSVTLSRFDITPAQQTQVADALSWLRRNPSALDRQLADQHLDASASRAVEAMLKRWVGSSQGVKFDCRVISESKTAAPLLAMIGSEVLGGTVKLIEDDRTGITPRPLRSDQHPGVDEFRLDGCLPAGASLPPLFPPLASFSRVRAQRHYNLTPPDLERHGMLLGTITEGSFQQVYFDQVARDRHLYVLGATGTGKSTLLANLICQDIREGRGICLIDPHGDLYDQIVESLPLNRANDVVMFNPSQLDRAPGLNVLECTGPNRSVQVNVAINDLLKTFDRMYDMRVAGGPMFETYFRNALWLLLESGLPAATLMELSLVFESTEYRQFLLARCRHPAVVGFWKDIAEAACGDTSLASMAPYITSKLNSFTCNAVIRPIIGQAESTIDFRKIMDRQGILLVKLPKGLLGEFDAQLLGSFLLSRIFAGATGRANVPAHKRPPFHLYVDEFQNFVNDGVAFMLAEARKYGLHLTLANQNLSQLAANVGRQNLLDAVLGNVGSLIAFRVGPPDAEKLRLYTEPEFSALDLQGLPNYHAVGRIMTRRGPTRPFIFATLPRDCKSTEEQINPVWEVRERAHTRPVAEVEAEIAARRNWIKTMATSPDGKGTPG
jgi:hypothetical protein